MFHQALTRLQKPCQVFPGFPQLTVWYVMFCVHAGIAYTRSFLLWACDMATPRWKSVHLRTMYTTYDGTTELTFSNTVFHALVCIQLLQFICRWQRLNSTASKHFELQFFLCRSNKWRMINACFGRDLPRTFACAWLSSWVQIKIKSLTNVMFESIRTTTTATALPCSTAAQSILRMRSNSIRRFDCLAGNSTQQSKFYY